MLGDYRALSRFPTALGIERKLCILGGVLAASFFRLGGSILATLFLFGFWWSIVYLLQTWEPRLIKMLPDLWRKQRAYCPKRLVPRTLERR